MLVQTPRVQAAVAHDPSKQTDDTASVVAQLQQQNQDLQVWTNTAAVWYPDQTYAQSTCDEKTREVQQAQADTARVLAKLSQVQQNAAALRDQLAEAEQKVRAPNAVRYS